MITVVKLTHMNTDIPTTVVRLDGNEPCTEGGESRGRRRFFYSVCKCSYMTEWSYSVCISIYHAGSTVHWLCCLIMPGGGFPVFIKWPMSWGVHMHKITVAAI